MFFLRVASAPLASVASDPSTRTAPGEAAPGRVMARAGMPGLRFSSHGNEICAISLPRQHLRVFGFVAFAVAWRILTYQKGRTALAVGGIFVAILLIFVELGFFIAVPQGGLLIYDHMRFDLLVTSNRYVYQTESGMFPP